MLGFSELVAVKGLKKPYKSGGKRDEKKRASTISLGGKKEEKCQGVGADFIGREIERNPKKRKERGRQRERAEGRTNVKDRVLERQVNITREYGVHWERREGEVGEVKYLGKEGDKEGRGKSIAKTIKMVEAKQLSSTLEKGGAPVHRR